MKKKLLVLVIGVVVLAVALLSGAAEEFLWKYVGRQAYTGTPEQAIKKLPLPAEVQGSFLGMVKRSGPAQGVIRKGDRLDAMVFGSGEMRTNVVAAWEDGVTELKTEEWTIVIGDKEFILKRPLTCNNWSIVIRPVISRSIAPVPTVPPAVEYAQVSGSPERLHTIIIRVWSAGSRGDLLAPFPGWQSRDLGVQLRAAAREGRLKSYPGEFNFKVEFRDLDFQVARGKTVFINSEPQLLGDGFGPTQNTIPISVKDGVGCLAIPTGVVTKDTAIIIYSPWLKPNIQYPPSGSLKTCGPSIKGVDVCGAEVKPGEPSEFYRLVTKHEVSNYHFVK